MYSLAVIRGFTLSAPDAGNIVLLVIRLGVKSAYAEVAHRFIPNVIARPVVPSSPTLN